MPKGTSTERLQRIVGAMCKLGWVAENSNGHIVLRRDGYPVLSLRSPINQHSITLLVSNLRQQFGLKIARGLAPTRASIEKRVRAAQVMLKAGVPISVADRTCGLRQLYPHGLTMKLLKGKAAADLARDIWDGWEQAGGKREPQPEPEPAPAPASTEREPTKAGDTDAILDLLVDIDRKMGQLVGPRELQFVLSRPRLEQAIADLKDAYIKVNSASAIIGRVSSDLGIGGEGNAPEHTG